jgi:hypothetical protein
MANFHVTFSKLNTQPDTSINGDSVTYLLRRVQIK